MKHVSIAPITSTAAALDHITITTFVSLILLISDTSKSEFKKRSNQYADCSCSTSSSLYTVASPGIERGAPIYTVIFTPSSPLTFWGYFMPFQSDPQILLKGSVRALQTSDDLMHRNLFTKADDFRISTNIQKTAGLVLHSRTSWQFW